MLEKECLCVGLSNSAALNYNQIFVNKLEAVTICPGPNIVNFSKLVSLQNMTDHIYGRANIIEKLNRPNLFVAELYLYIDYLKEELKDDIQHEQFEKRSKYYTAFFQNLRNGINNYRTLNGLSDLTKQQMLKDLDNASLELDSLVYQYELRVAS